MSDPKIPFRQPAVLELEAGEYWWCACGRSSNQPFCDGAHKGTEFSPKKVTIEETRRVALCQCKHTDNPPLCDGSHRDLQEAS